MHMVKLRTTITINKHLLKKAQQHDISISSFLDIELRRYIAYIEGKTINDSSHSGREKTSGKTLSQRARGLVGYDVSLTRRRS
jgi:hypothetical protein